MIPLVTKGNPVKLKENIMGVFVRSREDRSIGYILSQRQSEEMLCGLFEENVFDNITSNNAFAFPLISGIKSLSHLEDGDILNVDPSGVIHTLYRVQSQHNALFITDRCNSNCLMCSQPPKNKDDLEYFYELNRKLISLLPEDLEVIGITGGEPTILGERLLELLNSLAFHVPKAAVHMLSNGRIFAWKECAQKISITNDNLVIGIPVYSDNYLDHDYVVQAKDAFNQTIIGLHNLARYGQKVEVRVVLHKLTYHRLPQLARFIYKTLPFVDHVAFMGLEYIGYTPYNRDLLWMEPSKYMHELEEAVLYLEAVGMNVSIYNLQHCLLKDSLWKFSRKSISDWKRNYLTECAKCSKLEECGGVFSTSKILSNEIKALTV